MGLIPIWFTLWAVSDNGSTSVLHTESSSSILLRSTGFVIMLMSGDDDLSMYDYCSLIAIWIIFLGTHDHLWNPNKTIKNFVHWQFGYNYLPSPLMANMLEFFSLIFKNSNVFTTINEGHIYSNGYVTYQNVAQPGRALAWGARGSRVQISPFWLCLNLK